MDRERIVPGEYTLNLEMFLVHSYFQPMNRISILLLTGLVCAGSLARAQDSALEERINKLNGYVQDLLEDKANQKKQIESLAKEVQTLRDQQNQPNASYATQEDLRKLAEKFQDFAKESEKNRQADKELILKKIEDIGKALANVPPAQRQGTKPAAAPADPVPTAGGATQKGGTSEKGYGYYTIRSGDTLSSIAKAYNDQGIKLTPDQILKANPGLEERKLIVDKKIWIPKPPQ